MRVADAPFIFDLVNQPSWLENIGDKGVKSLQDAEAYILKIIEMYQTLGFGLYLVEHNLNGAAVGLCGLIKRDSHEDIEIGFALLPKFENKGYAFESATSIVNLARNEHQLNHLTAICKPDNLPSIKLLEKLEFKTELSTRTDDNGEPLKFLTLQLI